jgi:hypothetical protein
MTGEREEQPGVGMPRLQEEGLRLEGSSRGGNEHHLVYLRPGHRTDPCLPLPLWQRVAHDLEGGEA